MTREKIEDHLIFFDSILKGVSGMKNYYLDGKNEKIRNQAERNLDSAVRHANSYLQRNPDLFDFMVEIESCDPEYLEYPMWDHIERDTIRYMQALRNKLRGTPE